MLRVISTATAVAALFATSAPLQQFRSSVNTVEVYATVTDKSGRLIPNLTQADFEIHDNGKAQPITVFEAGVQVITIALMLDESPSLFESTDRTREAVAVFARSLLPGDRAALGAFSHLVRIEPKVSRNLVQQLNRLDDKRPRFPAGTALWEAIDASAAVLSQETGRRVILMLTDAEDNCSRTDPDYVRRRIEREGTMVYAIGLKGDGGLPVRELRDLAQDSGGYYFELKPGDDLSETFSRVADELHRQYLIGFSAPALDGKSHKLDVKVKKSGMTPRARNSYMATKAGGGQ